ncbi:hypothetical protein FGG08_004340 [Glutinoglossum americanum]|uniref:Bromo domain-containing protein n=1 Tax=Glutinoglossum americanum TaxID=1670608 RepID=A0A9P8L2U2_9PEZI|nr:hypothetical protein FGG08_004340 [Glutinoglossum americanum]
MSPDAEERARKRKKLPPPTYQRCYPLTTYDEELQDIDLSNGETPETTTEYGFNFLENLRQARDKRNRLIATHFLTLPDKQQHPDYYDTISLPVALDIVEERLTHREYPNLSALEADLKRLISNAKSYNSKTSEVFSDAEKVRKMLSDFMRKNNPAYVANPNHVTYPTATPTATPEKATKMERGIEPDGIAEIDGGRGRRRVVSSRPSNKKGAVNGEIAVPLVLEKNTRGGAKPNGFEGKSFQEAQKVILAEMVSLKDADGQEVSYPFVNLPSRKLVDYFALIKHPVSLKGLDKLVRGVQGRSEATGVSVFKTWKDFEDEVSYIWKNARQYNEDGSEITELAGQLETFFNRRLAEAKKAVPEPAHANGDSAGPQRIRLKVPPEPVQPKITLRVGAQKMRSPVNGASPAGSSNLTAAPADHGASQRQQQHAQGGADGQGPASSNGVSSRPRNPFGSSQSGSSSAPIPTLGQLGNQGTRSVSSTATSPTPSAPAVKSETRAEQSPSLAGAPLVNGAGESITVRRGSQGSNPGPNQNISTSSMPPPSSVGPRLPSDSPAPGTANPQTQYPHAPAFGLDSRWRHPGKDASDALISNLKICTHPGLKLSSPFRLDLPPSQTSTQQSITINLPSTHYFLQVVPTIAPVVGNRQTKLIATHAGQRLNPVPQLPGQTDLRRPLYEVRLVVGVNKIEVEMVAGLARGAQKVGGGQDAEFEKFTVFANLMKP